MTISTISVPINTEQFLLLVETLKYRKDTRDPVRIIAVAIDEWILSSAGINLKTEAPVIPVGVGTGYQWKQAFLPHGTKLRTKFKGEYYYAEVKGDKILYKAQEVTPSGFVNAVSGGVRNSWLTVWVLRPQDVTWLHASHLRSI